MGNREDTYAEIYDTLNEKRKVVYKLVAEHPDCTYNDLCRITGRNSNDITGRLRELIDSGHVIISGDKIDPITHKKNATHRIRLGNEDMESRAPAQHSLRIFPEDIDAVSFALTGTLVPELWDKANGRYFIGRTMYRFDFDGTNVNMTIDTASYLIELEHIRTVEISKNNKKVRFSTNDTKIILKVAGSK